MDLACNPESITHLHLLSVISTEITLRKLGSARRINILDAGCGNGHLITFLHINLHVLFPDTTFTLYGYDVGDHDVQPENYFSATKNWCRKHCPDVDWETRLKIIAQNESWPFDDCTFDIVISNQVVEHVWDHKLFFSEHYRVLKEKGYGIHIFPLKHYVYEGHLHLPFVHRIMDWETLSSYIRYMSLLGFGKYTKSQSDSLETYSERHADYITFCTNYLSYSELYSLVKSSALRPSLKYTSEYYKHKIRQLLGMNNNILLNTCTIPVITAMSNHILKYVSAITLFVDKNNTYTTS